MVKDLNSIFTFEAFLNHLSATSRFSKLCPVQCLSFGELFSHTADLAENSKRLSSASLPLFKARFAILAHIEGNYLLLALHGDSARTSKQHSQTVCSQKATCLA